MLSDDIRHLSTQVDFFLARDLHSPHFLGLVIERLDALADRAAAMEAMIVPERLQSVIPSQAGNVIGIDAARRRLGR